MVSLRDTPQLRDENFNNSGEFSQRRPTPVDNIFTPVSIFMCDETVAVPSMRCKENNALMERRGIAIAFAKNR